MTTTTNSEESWKSEVLPEINEGCLECIKTVERNHNKATPTGCVNHTDWPTASASDRYRCGAYSISSLYYDTCKVQFEYSSLDITTGYTWESCAKNDTCSTNCVRKYVNSRRDVTCDRESIESRLCVDYGIIHAFKENACALRRDNRPDVKEYARWMEEECGVSNPPVLDPTTVKPNTNAIVGVVIPVLASTMAVVIIMAIIIFLIRRKRQIQQKDIILSVRSANNYGSDPGSPGMTTNFLSAYNMDQCSPQIQEMVKAKLISVMDMEVMEEIGRGQFGVIRKAYCYTNTQHTHKVMVAVKMMRCQQAERYEEEMQSLLREAHIMSQFDHVNVLNLIGIIWEHGEQPAVVCPYMGKGSLLDLIKKAEISFSELDLLNFVVQISAGLEYLEAMKFVHRDIALRNCLVSELYVIKISDFGLTRDIYDSRIYECNDVTEKRLPWKWLAPECIKQGSFTHKSDVWSFGVTIWELYADGSSPYPAIGNLSVLQDCLEAGYRLSKPDKLSQPLYDLMRLMWNNEPSFRPSFAELQAAIKLQMTAAGSDAGDYSYTMHTENPPVEHTELAGDSVSDYMQPLHRETQRESNIYADSPANGEPDIYS